MNDQEQKKRQLQVSDAEVISNATRPSKIIFVLLCAVPMFAMLLYGGVDMVMLGIFSLITTLIVILWIMDAWSLRELRFSNNTLQLPMIGLILIGLIQLLPLGDPGSAVDALNIAPNSALSVAPWATRLFTVRFFAYLIFFAAALTFVDTERRSKKLLFSILTFGSLFAFAGILQKVASPDAMYGYRQSADSIPFGPLINQHHFAAFMEMTSGLALGLLFGTGLKREHKPFLMIAAALMGIAIVFTGSRGGMISYAGVIAFVLIASYAVRRRSGSTEGLSSSGTSRVTAALGIVALVFVVAGSAFYLGGGDSLLRGIGLNVGDADITTGRIQFWTIALKIFAAHPILGSGLDSYRVANTFYDPQNGTFLVEHAHNDYLQILSDTGILGFACIVAFVVLLFRDGIKNISGSANGLGQSIAIGALAGCLGIAIHSFFDFPLRTPANALFFLLLVVLATTKYTPIAKSGRRSSV